MFVMEIICKMSVWKNVLKIFAPLSYYKIMNRKVCCRGEVKLYTFLCWFVLKVKF